MNRGEQVDYSTLNWVKDEIDQTLKQARLALEAFSDDTDDEAQMRFCVTHLHQVQGTLQLVELYGAALFAEEMEKVAAALAEGRIAHKQETFETLMGAILQLPAYLEQLQAGKHDIPVALLPVLNDLRASRGEQLLSESAFFTPDLAAAPSALMDPDGEVPDLISTAKSQRFPFQAALVGWYRGAEPERNLRSLREVVQSLRAASRAEPVAQLFWVADGLIDALLNHGIDASVSTKLLLGQVDRQIKRLMDEGEQALADDPPSDLTRNILYYVTRAEIQSERVQEIKRAFSLENTLPSESDVDQFRATMSGVNTDAMQAVYTAVREDIVRITDALEAHVRSGERNSEDLRPLTDLFKKLADTLGMLGLGVERNTIQEQAATIKAMIAGEVQAEDTALMDVAGALLYVDARLGDNRSGPGIACDEMDVGQAEARSKAVQRNVIAEAKADMTKVKDAIVAFVSAPWEFELLTPIPALGRHIKGSLSMLSLESAAALLERCTRFVERDLLEQERIPDQETLDAFADAVIGIEYYLEAVDENRVDSDSILELVRRSIDDLHASSDEAGEIAPSSGGRETVSGTDSTELAVDPVVDDLDVLEQILDESDFDLEVLELSLEPSEQNAGEVDPEESRAERTESDPAPAAAELVIPAETQADAVQQDVGTEANAPAEEQGTVIDTSVAAGTGDAPSAGLTEGPPVWTEQTVDSVSASFADPDVEFEEMRSAAESVGGGETAAGSSAIAETPPAADGKVNDGSSGHAPTVAEVEDLDEDIKEIFLEEAAEELANIRENLPEWKGKPDDEEALAAIRRSFHTLKGSGRMVGAADIGEFAWAFENMLNRVIDKSVEPRPEIFEMVEQALAVAAQLVDGFRNGTLPSADAQTLATRADTVADWMDAPSLSAPTALPPSAPEHQRPAIVAEQAKVEPSDPHEQEVPEPAGAEATEVELPAQEPTDVIDPVLLDIFKKESKGHLRIVRAFLDQCRNEPEGGHIDEDLIRAIHTLHGSAHMAAISDIAEVGNAWERYVKLLSHNGIRLREEGLELLDRSLEAITEFVESLTTAGAALPEKEFLIERASALYEGEAREIEHHADTALPPEHTGAARQTEDVEAGLREAEYDSELMDIFLEEGVEILDASEGTLQAWRNEPESKDLVNQLQRELHTLKGGARMAGVVPVGDLSHSLESMIIAVVEDKVAVSKRLFDIMQTSHDRLTRMLEEVRSGTPLQSARELILEINQLVDRGGLVTEEPAASVDAPSEEARASAPPELESDTTPGPETEQAATNGVVVPLPLEPVALQQTQGLQKERRAKPRVQHEQVRVRADLLDSLVNVAGEASIYRSRVEQQIGVFKYNLSEMDQTVLRLREQLRQFEIETEAQIMYRFEEASDQYDEEFDPLELDRFSYMQQLSRSLMESVGDLVSIQELMDGLTRESETLLLQQSRVNTELQEGLMRTRMVPFSVQIPRLRRIVRQTSSELGKEVEFHARGEDGELDRTVLERVMAPLEHMLRNAIDHGIETPEVREEKSKARAGTVILSLAREGAEIVLKLEDDGRGLDLEAIRRKAQERGLIKPGADLTDKETMQFILESGFSTAETVTQISGRGVGMDVVNSEIKQLGGTLYIDSTAGYGTSFTVRLPLTLSINKAILVHVGEDNYAVPLSGVEAIVQVTHEQLESFYESKGTAYSYASHDYRFMHLGSLLGVSSPQLPGPGKKAAILLVRAGDHRAALQVEALLGSREIVVKSVGPQISSVRGISGATILGDGSVALILDISAVVLIDVALRGELAHDAASQQHRETTVMVVDDSITVRRITSRLLERNDFRAITAKDGVDAVALLQEHTPDMFLLDIEMPRMDGYELAQHIRNNERLRDIPIIMITSRTGDKHKQRAVDIGVNRYLGKPYQEGELLESIQSLLQHTH